MGVVFCSLEGLAGYSTPTYIVIVRALAVTLYPEEKEKFPVIFLS